MIDWEVSNLADTEDGYAETMPKALAAAFRNAKNFAAHSPEMNITVTVAVHEIHVIPGEMYPDQADNSRAAWVAMHSLRADMLAALA
jgi:NAD/NADP transhydrogenase alpha subunit